MNKKQLWNLCCAAIVVLAILTFTPIVTPSGVDKPELMGMPYTLWVGILQYILFIVVIWVGTRVHPGRWEK